MELFTDAETRKDFVEHVRICILSGDAAQSGGDATIGSPDAPVDVKIVIKDVFPDEEDVRLAREKRLVPLIHNREGLLAVKIMEMQKRKIPFHLEAAVPVTSADLSAADLCRAVGILLDNAMEAAEEFCLRGKYSGEGEDHSAVKAIFCQDASGLSVIVSNPVREEADFSRIWEDGYSTRGVGRGTGLTSLRRIVEAGSNISLRTSWDHGIFTQELQIGTGVNGK